MISLLSRISMDAAVVCIMAGVALLEIGRQLHVLQAVL